MNITYHTEPFHYIEIENLYTEEENKIIFDEILNHTHIFEGPEKLYSASIDGEYITKKNGYFWDLIYQKREHSRLLELNSRLFTTLQELTHSEHAMRIDFPWYFRNLVLNHDETLVSYYGNGGYYNPHADNGRITALTWYWKEPKSFEGGELVFHDYDLKIELKQNYTIVFPSMIAHAVKPLEMDTDKADNYYGRFSMTQFASYCPIKGDGRNIEGDEE